jgi:KUP system potassium uptake protein
MSQAARQILSPGHEHPKKISPTLVLAALGVVFGDIGTSPLYTVQVCLSGEHSAVADRANVLGVTSLILWAVTLVVTIKYLTFLMRADNHGEGGILALLALVPPRVHKGARIGLVAGLVIVGAALLFGDGIITPAISVLSAVEGLQSATPKLHAAIVPITLVILVGLFWAQRRGTAKLGTYFGPIMFVWFTTIGALGVAHIVRAPGVLAALSPTWGVRFFLRNGWLGFRVLGGVVLAVTGGEALYADMGHFGRTPIRISWLGLIYPSLLLCYLGQGATIIQHHELATDPFYAMVPHALLYPMVVLAAAATVIASQALISGVFSLTHQAIQLGYFPRLTILHTSGEAEGQIYVPLVNWGLAVACLLLVVIFRESAKLAAAFGLAVSGTMLITSLTYHTVIRHAWGWPRWRAALIVGFFLMFDIPFVGANTLKFWAGGYIPFTVGAIFVVIMMIWRVGRSYAHEHLAAESIPVEELVRELDELKVTRAPGTAIYLASEADGVPPPLVRTVRRFRSLHEEIVLLTVITEHVPVVNGERSTRTDLGHGIHRLVVRFGFMEQPNVPRALGRPGELLFVLGRETYVATDKNKMSRVPETLFELLSRNARRASDYFMIPPEQVIEIGSHVDL